MTRKRFVKLLMSEGYSRNEAVDYAVTLLSKHGSYSEMYLQWLIDRDNPAFSEALTRLCEAAAVAARSIVDALINGDWPRMGQLTATQAAAAEVKRGF